MFPLISADPKPEPALGARRHDPARADVLIGRRDATRHRVGVAARFVAPGVSLRVQLEDISASGACLRVMHRAALPAGRLRWLGFEVFGHPAWQHDERCGLRFEEPLEREPLRRTLEFAEKAASDARDLYRRLASAWAHGPGDY